MPKLTKQIEGVVDGEVYPRVFAEGDECPESLLDYAQGVGAVGVSSKASKASKKAPENK